VLIVLCLRPKEHSNNTQEFLYTICHSFPRSYCRPYINCASFEAVANAWIILNRCSTACLGVRGNEIADWLARSGSGQRFIGPEPFLEVSRQNISRKMKRWMKNQHLALWRGPCSTQRQARELISGPVLATGARLLSFNRTQTRVVIGLLTGPNTLRDLYM
jgi:hypothetical protein